MCVCVEWRGEGGGGRGVWWEGCGEPMVIKDVCKDSKVPTLTTSRSREKASICSPFHLMMFKNLVKHYYVNMPTSLLGAHINVLTLS